MYLLGLSGDEFSKQKREELLMFLNLPHNLTANAMLDVLNTLFTKEKFIQEVAKWQSLGDKN
jgi:hypothetical protein